MSRSRLARRIVFAVLLLVAGLFLALGLVAVRVADARVETELDAAADRVARELEGLQIPAQHRPAILASLAALVRAEIAVTGGGARSATVPAWSAGELAALRAGRVRLQGVEYRVKERALERRPERCFLLTREQVVRDRRDDVLVPIIATGALGLLIAAGTGLWVARSIAAPVRALAATAQRVADGTFAGDLARRGPGEIGDLEEAFGRMLRSLRDQEARLRESERFAALGRITGGIAHELRNPLTAVRIAVETSLSEDAAGRAEAREMALAEIDRLDRTLKEMLDYVRPRQPRLERVEVDRLLHECARLLQRQCDHLRVRIEVEAPEGIALTGDPDRLKQAVLNLLLNAIQAQPGGGVVRLCARDREIEVRDCGPGIPEEVRDKIFEPFVTTKAAGIGLGLAVVKQVADEHGAQVSFTTGSEGTSLLLRFRA
ncbi:MAG: ATP-binding protein [Planctomycetaceae bacterium]